MTDRCPDSSRSSVREAESLSSSPSTTQTSLVPGSTSCARLPRFADEKVTRDFAVLAFCTACLLVLVLVIVIVRLR